MGKPLSDDSLRLQAEGECPDAGVSSHTVRSLQPHERALLTTTHALVCTVCELGSIFTPGPQPGNPPQYYSVANVQENYLYILFVKRTTEMVLPADSVAFIPAHTCGGESPWFGKEEFEYG